MAETLRRTALSRLGEGDPVNLEPSLKASGGVEGHFVLGHIDCVGTVSKAAKSGGQFELEVKYPDRYDPLVVEKGSVAVDGVSLTVGRAARGAFSVYAIPHTLKETTLGTLRVKDGVNLEFDIIGKHIAKLELSRRTGITEEFLRLHGF
jgi:riboflavin synthase